MRTTLRMVWVVAAAVVLAVVEGPGWASRMPEPPLDPRTYASPSGRYQLLVDPSRIHGQGEGTYRMTRDGAEVWAGRLPYTLFAAEVTDDGVVAGYGYTQGVEGFAPAEERDWRRGYGEVVIAILGPDGKARVERRIERQGSRFLHADPTPIVEGMFVDSGTDRLVVILSDEDVNRQDDRWEVYALSTGEARGTQLPKRKAGPGVRGAVATMRVPGTELAVVQWRLDQAWEYGARFTLIDAAGEVVWTLDRPAGFELEVDGGESGRFRIRSAGAKERVAFDARREGGGWVVKERGREPWEGPAKAAVAQAEALPRIELKKLGTLALGSGPTTRPVRGHVRDVSVDERGRIGFVRHEGADRAIVVLRPDGELLREIQVAGTSGKDVGRVTLDPVGGDRWLVTASGYGETASARAWWVDVGTGVAAPVGVALACPPVEEASGMPDGGFVVLTSHHRRSTIERALIAFGADGRQRWRIDAKSGHNSKLFSPEDVAVTRDGQVAVLDNIRKEVAYFSAGGAHLHTLALERVFGREPNYPSAIAADVSGGVVVHDFNGTPPVWRVSRAGEALAKYQPRFGDGRTVRVLGVPAATATGKLWATDGVCLMQLTREGVVERVIGEEPDPGVLSEVSSATTGADGRVYAVAGRTGAVHVFEPDGRRVRVCVPEPTDFASDARPAVVTLDGAGNVYVGNDQRYGRGEARYVVFDRDGRRTGVVPATEDSVTVEWRFVPGSAERWVKTYRDVLLVGADGKVKKRVSRHADRTWLDTVACIAVASDGGVAVMSRRGNTSGAPPAVTTYTAAGVPVRMVTLPVGVVFAMAYDGRRVFMATPEGVRVVSVEEGAVHLFDPDPRVAEKSAWVPMVTPDGKELWLLARGTGRVERYAMP